MGQPISSCRWAIIALLLSGNAVFFWQLRHPIILFASRAVNEDVGFALGLSLPWLAAVAIYRVGKRWRKIIAAAKALPACCWCGTSIIFILRFSKDVSAAESGIEIMAEGSACMDLPSSGREYRLKPFVYF